MYLPQERRRLPFTVATTHRGARAAAAAAWVATVVVHTHALLPPPSNYRGIRSSYSNSVCVFMGDKSMSESEVVGIALKENELNCSCIHDVS